MPHRLRRADTLPPFERTFYLELLKSEVARTSAMAWLFAGFVVFSLLGLMAVHLDWGLGSHLRALRFPAGELLPLAAFGLVYSLGIHALFRTALVRRIVIPEIGRFGNAFGETTIVSAVLFVFAGVLGPTAAFQSPAMLFYFFFILLSVLRLRFSLGLFYGFVAAAQFLALGMGLLGPDERLAAFLVPKAGLLALFGAGAGWVGHALRRRLAATVAAHEERERVVDVFGQHVSPSVVDKLLAEPAGAAPAAGEVREVAVMFLDIRGFTRASERRTPAETIDYLNALFAPLIAVVGAHGGIVNKFLGDGFLAVFGAPLDDHDAVANAYRAAVECADLAAGMSASGLVAETRVGIGLHWGPVVTGSVGSAERKEYTVIGDTVNLASRVEQLTKDCDATLLVTAAVYERVRDLAGPLAPLLPMPVKGRDEPVTVYKVR